MERFSLLATEGIPMASVCSMSNFLMVGRHWWKTLLIVQVQNKIRTCTSASIDSWSLRGLKGATKAWRYEHCDMDPAAQCSKKFKFLEVAWIGMLFMPFMVLQSDFSFVNVADWHAAGVVIFVADVLRIISLRVLLNMSVVLEHEARSSLVSAGALADLSIICKDQDQQSCDTEHHVWQSAGD